MIMQSKEELSNSAEFIQVVANAVETLLDIRNLLVKLLVYATEAKVVSIGRAKIITPSAEFPTEIMEDDTGHILWWDAANTSWRPISELTLREEDGSVNSTSDFPMESITISDETMLGMTFDKDFYV